MSLKELALRTPITGSRTIIPEPDEEEPKFEYEQPNPSAPFPLPPPPAYASYSISLTPNTHGGPGVCHLYEDPSLTWVLFCAGVCEFLLTEFCLDRAGI